MLRRLITVVVVLAAALSTSPAGAAGPPTTIIPPDVDCRTGEVALTFDDGPDPRHTPRLLEVLRREKAQVTFFVQGQHVVDHPDIVREALADGHAIENHSWDHPALAPLKAAKVRRQLERTQDAIEDATGRTPAFYRPPYGSTDGGVRKVARRLGLEESLWTIDTTDWDGLSTRRIHRAALRGLRPGGENVILMHDAVTNSGRSIKAVPGIIRDLRKKGYCLVPMEDVAPPGRVGLASRVVGEGSGRSSRVALTLTLDGPAQRDSSVRVTTVGGTAVAGTDFEPVDTVVEFPRGASDATVEVVVHADPKPNTAKRFAVRLSDPKNLTTPARPTPVVVTDDDTWSRPTDGLIAPSTRARG